MSALERVEAARRDLPEVAGALVGIIADNPAQFAMVASGSYVVTRSLGRLVRPTGPVSAVMTAAASYGVCWYLLAEARRRGLLKFKIRHPITGELVTTAELERELADLADVPQTDFGPVPDAAATNPA